MNFYSDADRHLRLMAAMMFSAMIMLAPQVMAATITVNSTLDTTGNAAICTLRDAITSANDDTATGGCAAGSGDDTITFASGLSGQTIILSSELPYLDSISVDGSGLASHVRISGNGNYRVFKTNSRQTVIITHLDIINGKSSFGGAIFNAISILSVNNCTFSGNSADGGGIYNLYGTVNVSSSIFSGNSARNYGGGIMNDRGSLTVSSSTFSGNSASGIDSGGISGGGICNMDGTLTVSSSTFSGNSGSYGGSIVNDGGGSLTVSSSIFSGNSASKYGGGIFNGNMLTVSNSTFSGNSAIEYYGGGIYSGVGSTLTVSSSTFSGNSAVRGGGICNYKSTLTLINNILADSTGGGDCVNNGGSPVIAMNNNLIKSTGTNACGLTNGADGNIIGSDPMLSTLADNGGSTQTMALQAGSPAINAGNASECTDTDQRGYARISRCDIGAYEYGSVGPPPAAPSGLTATAVSQTQINLSWTDNSTDETGFKIYHGATLVTTTSPNAASFSDTGLVCGTTYYYQLKSTNANGDSAAVTASATTSACSAPAPVVMFDPVSVSTFPVGARGYALAIDNSGNLYSADYGNYRILAIAIAAGAVTTLAGSGVSGYLDAVRTAAQFGPPSGIAMASGDLYVADPYNNRIRKIITATGAVTTLAGQSANGWFDGTGTAAQFDFPAGIAADNAGNLYVADQSNNRIRKIVISTGEVSTLAGDGTPGSADNIIGTLAQFSGPCALAAASGNLYVTDRGNHLIRKIVIATGEVTTLAGSTQGFADAAGTAAQFDMPCGIAADNTGNLYVADWNNNRIRKIVISTKEVTTLAGSASSGSADGIGIAAQFNHPSGVTADTSGNLYAADYGNNRIRKMTPTELTGFSTITGTSSPAKSFAVSGNFLTGNLTITAPTGYEVSLSSGSGYAASLNITPTAGAVNANLIYIRLQASAGVGTYNGNITLDSSGAAQKTLAVTGAVTAVPVPEINLKQGAADIVSGGSYNFGNVNVGNGAAITFTIENSGTGNLTFSGSPIIAISGSSDFSVDQSGVSSPIAASGSKNFTVTFTPSSSGSKTAQISIANNDSDEGSYTVNLSGTVTIAPTPPVTAGVTLNSVSSSPPYTATATATGPGIGERGFFWWIPPSPETHWGGSESGLLPAGGYGAGDFSLNLTGLKAGNKYHVKAYIKVGGQLISSDEQIFTAASGTGKTAPTVITKSCTLNADGTVSANGEITDIGSSAVNVYGFVYAKHPAPYTGDNMASTGDRALALWDKAPVYQGMSFAGTVKNLSPGKWYLRAYAHNDNPDSDAAQTASLGYGADCTFTVPCTPETCISGDLSGDGKVDLTDAMLVLRILAGIPVGNINIYADVNNDGKIGLPELGFILQKTAGLR